MSRTLRVAVVIVTREAKPMSPEERETRNRFPAAFAFGLSVPSHGSQSYVTLFWNRASG